MPAVVKARSRDFYEVVIAFGLILLVVWTPNPLQRVLFWVAFAWIVASTVSAHSDLKDLGLELSWKLSSLLRILALIAAGLMLAGFAVWVSIRMNTLHELYGQRPLFSRVWGYVIWSFMQQFILQVYFLTRLLRIVPSRLTAILLAAAMFSSAHLPNPVLTIATLVWGIAACALFVKHREIYSLGALHAIFGLAVAFTVPNAIHHHMRVGLGYIHYHRHYSQSRDPKPPGQNKEQSPVAAPAARQTT